VSDIHQPLVSVLVPIYNVETYLEQCLSSLAAQTLKDIEVICINDGSTDSSPAIIRSFMNRDPRFHLVDKENSGYGDSMNRGLDAARGKYVAILESDDFMEPDGLEYMVEQAERASLEVFKCNFWLYWSKPTENHSFRHNLYFPLASPEMIEMGPHAPVDYPEVFWSKASIWSALYLRGFLEENHIRFPSHARCLLPGLQLHLQGACVRASHCLLRSRLCPLSTGQREVLGQLQGQGLLHLRRACRDAPFP
jgi:glycosyltransferase involved in cell wall biosynthesis